MPSLLGPLSLALALLAADSAIQDDETVVLFPALGRPEADGSGWTIELRGWIHEREEDSGLRGLFLGLVRAAMGSAWKEKDEEAFLERAGGFLVDNERGKAIAVRLGEREYPMEPSGPNGHFRGAVRLTAEEVRRLAGGAAGVGERRVRLRAVTREGEGRRFEGEAHLLEESGVSVVSDIDDTVKVSEVLDKKKLLANTLLREYRAVPGMAELYASWRVRGASFHYVTGSPWQLHGPLSELFAKAGLPAGTFHMRSFRWTDASLLDLLASPVEHKKGEIEGLFKAFPKRRFVLVGDSGEKDPEVYGAAARAHPGQAALVLIRDVTGEGRDAPRMREAFRDVPGDRWQLFREPAEVERVAREKAFEGR